MPLKDVAVRKAKPSDKPRKLSDGGGLHILIQPTGGKLWRLAYRFAGKQKTLALGAYPAVPLEEARRRRDEAKALLARSIDPSVQRKADKHAGKNSSFRAVAEELIAKLEREGRAQATLIKKHWLFSFAYPAFGDRPVAEITARDLLALEPTLTAATRNLGDRVEIRIRDNGTGIPREVREKMFNPFFTTKPAGEGTGLGLSISHDIIVKQHAGSIEVDTQPGQFTELRTVLPRAAAPLGQSGGRA
jgi:hypothetical protein